MTSAATASPTPRAPGNDAPPVDARQLLGELTALVEPEMRAVDGRIRDSLQSDIALIRSLSEYIIGGGGKRLRPVTLLLCAKALDAAGDEAVQLAAVVEFIHTATLLHDDVVDGSDLRRGNATANAVWGNDASVLVGDFLYSRAFEMMVATGRMAVMEVMAETTNRIAEGEVLQLLNAHSPEVDEARYIETITRKTAKLFEAAARLAAIVGGASDAVGGGLARYGLHLGIAFQMVDDLLDYTQDAESMGKERGDDLAEGKPTLPLIHALSHAGPEDRALIRGAIKNGERDKFERIVEIIESTGAVAYTSRRAREEATLAKSALDCLPNSRYRQALASLADFSVARTF